MPPKLHAHPFSSYCQKVLIALYENDTPFTFRMLAFDDAEAATELAGLWPLRRMPILVDDGRVVPEATVIIEHLQLHHPDTLTSVRAYRQRLLARPSFARAVDEARPYRRFFPPGAPDRD